MDDELQEAGLAEQGQQGAAEGQLYQPQVMQQLAQLAADRRARMQQQPGMGMQGGVGGMQAPWTQASDQRLQRLSNGLSTIQQQVDSGELAPHEGQAFQQQIQGAMAPLMAQKQQATQAGKQQAVHQALESSAMDMGVRLANMKHLADAYPSTIIKHDVDGVPVEFHQDGEGKIVQTDMRKTHMGAMKGMSGEAGSPFGQMPQQAYNPANLKPKENDPPVEPIGPNHPAFLGALTLPSLIRYDPEAHQDRMNAEAPLRDDEKAALSRYQKLVDEGVPKGLIEARNPDIAAALQRQRTAKSLYTNAPQQSQTYQTYPRNPDGSINYAGQPIARETNPMGPPEPQNAPSPVTQGQPVASPPQEQAAAPSPSSAQVIPPHIMTITNGSHIQKFAFQKNSDGQWDSKPVYDNRPQDSQNGGGLTSDHMADLLRRTEQQYIQDHPRPSMYARTPQQAQMARALNAEWNQGLMLRLHAAAQFAQAGIHQNYAIDLANLRSGNRLEQIQEQNELATGRIKLRGEQQSQGADSSSKILHDTIAHAQALHGKDTVLTQAMLDESEKYVTGLHAKHGHIPVPGAAPQASSPSAQPGLNFGANEFIKNELNK